MPKTSTPATEPDSAQVVNVWSNPGVDMNFAELAHQADSYIDSRTVTGDGFTYIGTTKQEGDLLIDVPMILTDWRPVPGDFETEYWTITAVLGRPVFFLGEHLTKVRFNAGGSGIPPILEALNPPAQGGKVLLCRKGLRKSEYINEHGPGVTYYIA